MAGLDGCGKLDIWEMSPDNIVVIGNKVWVRAEVEEKIWIYDGVPCTVIKLGEACYARPCDDLDAIPLGLLGGLNALNMFMECPSVKIPPKPKKGEPPAPKPPEENPCGDDGSGCSENYEDPCYTPGGCNQETPPPEEQSDPTPGANVSNGNTRKAKSVEAKQEDIDKNAKPAINTVDIRSINALGWKSMAVIPSAAVIPMRSNTLTYGPYASSNFGTSCGGTNVEVNPDLAPWVFGSIGAMNAAGQTLVESAAIGLVKAETGAITIPGMPISQFTQLGAVLGSGGATLSSMNFSYGSGGISTSYEFRTYTPKFGGLTRNLIDKIKDISKNRTEALRFFRNQSIMINKSGRQRMRFDARIAAALADPRARGANNRPSLQRVFIGEIYDWQNKGQRTVLGTDKLNDSAAEMVNEYNRKAYVSWDYFYGPISKYGDGSLPRFASYETGCHLSSSDLPQPPYTIDEYPSDTSEPTDLFINGLDQNNLNISQKYLDPLTNNIKENTHHHDGEGRGHVIDLVGRSDSVPDYGLITNFYHLDDEDRYSEDYRFFALRGPIMLQSWGYDTQGKPIPNEADDENNTREGKFKADELKNRFMKDWLGKPASWPVAPIDFRFDRKRGVWVTPPGYKVVVAVLDEKLNAYGTAAGSLINKDTTNNKEFGPILYDKNGEEVKATDENDTKAKIKIVDRIGLSLASGTKVYCYYDTFKCEYIVIEAARKTSIRFKLIDLCSGTPVEPDYGDVWTKYAGYGDKFPNNHILGIRINCEGDPIDNKGNFISHEDIEKAADGDEEKKKQIFINLWDTCGRFGAARAYYDIDAHLRSPQEGLRVFNEWKQEAATGFGLLCDPASGGNYCLLGEKNTQCSTVNDDYESYDMIFLDGYARFIECELTQKLYATEYEARREYPEDSFKQGSPKGNAAATIQFYYGDPGNGVEPKFYKNDQGGLSQIDFRVFDPFEGYEKHLNPFAHLDKGDKVLAVFDEDRKKYVIYQALRLDEKIIKFALVDNKDIGDRTPRAVLVDLEGYPIDADGERLTAENFEDNFITVFDPFAIHGYIEPVTKYHNWGTTGFGPALGSEVFDEHLNGIELKAGDWNPPDLPGNVNTYKWKGGPFIGYAIHRKMTNGVQEEYKKYKFDNEIIFLEKFANIIVGKIASTKPIIESAYYLGVIKHTEGVQGGFVDGRIPFTRDAVHEKANVRVAYAIDQHQAGKYITGDFYEEYKGGDVYNNVDGCRFIAKLDPVASKVNDGNDERLYYSIIEVDNIANRGITAILNKERSNEINEGKINEKADKTYGIYSEYLDGFMWNRDKKISAKKYEKTTIYNRNDWTKKALIMKWNDERELHINTSLGAYNQDDGTISYRITHAGTIAQVGEATVPPNLAGKFGHPGAINIKDDKKIGQFYSPLFYHGLNPLDASALRDEVESQPTIEVSNAWMTYDGAGILTLWNETAASKIEDANYRVVYAREAPVIITGQAYATFRPEHDEVSIILNDLNSFSSCPGFDRNPIPAILTRASNAMGYGAATGDLVTLQRVFLSDINNPNNANYKYMVIGTNKPPGACSASTI